MLTLNLFEKGKHLVKISRNAYMYIFFNRTTQHACHSYSQLSRKRTPWVIEKCTLVELSAYENYFNTKTPKENRVDVHLQESWLAGIIMFY